MTNLALAKQLAQTLSARELKLVTAESCTGGGIATLLTDISGASLWYERGFVTYSNTAKSECLNIDIQLIEQHGAVSEATAKAMAKGALENSHADVSIAVTGIAGPGGGSEAKPVGTVFLGFASTQFATSVQQFSFSGDRRAVREQSIEMALTVLLQLLGERLKPCS